MYENLFPRYNHGKFTGKSFANYAFLRMFRKLLLVLKRMEVHNNVFLIKGINVK